MCKIKIKNKPMKLIIGLGNPDKEYQATRHNFGQLVLEALGDKKNLSWENNKKTNSLTADWPNSRYKIILATPLSYMNESGQVAKALKTFYKIPTHKIIVIHDDLDLPFGKIRLSKSRGDAGHQGVASIIKYLKSKDFKRIRLGLGPQQGKSENFVLQKFTEEEKRKLPEIIDTCHLILEDILTTSFDEAANKYN
jgi:PTH1 family peptidyl-tRNA hydrolase